MATNNMHNMSTLIKRLEAATSRLEDIATSVNALEEPATTINGALPSSSNARSSPTPSQSTPKALAASAPAPTVPQAEDLPTEIEEFDKLLAEELATFVRLSEGLDPVLGEQSKELKSAFTAQRTFLLIATKAKKPDEGDYMELLKDTQMKMMAVDEVRQGNRATHLKDHLAMVGDGSATLSWVTVDHKPADVAAELFGGAQMYGNKILRQYKDKEESQVEWVKAFNALMRALVAYIRQYYSRGIPWNPQGLSATDALKEVNTKSSGTPPAPASAASGPPPPPLPPPPSMLMPSAPPTSKKAGSSDMGAIFQQLNQGEKITSGLKKVDPSQQTHKNPTLRANDRIPTRSSSQGSTKSIPPHTKPKPESMRTKKPPRKELDGNKWIIENFESPSSPVEIEAELNHSILISKCKSTTIRVVGKANAISIDSSSKTSIIIDSLVSSVDVIKCPSFALQVLESLPSVLLDQVDGATIYLNKDSLATEIMTSKCSSINVYLPPSGAEEDDYKECNVPEQFRSYVKDGKLVTEIVEHKG